MAKRSKSGKGVRTSQSTRKQRTAKSGRKRKQDSPSDAESFEPFSRPKQIAPAVVAERVPAIQPTHDQLFLRLMRGDVPKRHCPIEVTVRFNSVATMLPWFFKRINGKSFVACTQDDAEWDSCEVLTAVALKPLWHELEAPSRRRFGPSGGVASQWLHLSDECETALRSVRRKWSISGDDQDFRLGEVNAESLPPERNIKLGTSIAFPVFRELRAFYRPKPLEVEGRVQESPFDIGLSAAGHAVLFWATMHTRLQGMLRSIKDPHARLALRHSQRFVVEATPVLEWTESDIDKLNEVRGEVLALDREWDTLFKEASPRKASKAIETPAINEAATKQTEENRRAKEEEAKHAATAQDDPKFQPASAFPVEVRGLLRMAASPKRRGKKVRSRGSGAAREYSLVDARHNWPDKFAEAEAREHAKAEARAHAEAQRMARLSAEPRNASSKFAKPRKGT